MHEKQYQQLFALRQKHYNTAEEQLQKANEMVKIAEDAVQNAIKTRDEFKIAYPQKVKAIYDSIMGKNVGKEDIDEVKLAADLVYQELEKHEANVLLAQKKLKDSQQDAEQKQALLQAAAMKLEAFGEILNEQKQLAIHKANMDETNLVDEFAENSFFRQRD